MSESLKAHYPYKDNGPGDSQGFGRPAWGRLRFYARFAWRFVVLRQPDPLIYGIAITDRCNLACRGCRVSNTGRPDMTWDRLGGTPQGARRGGLPGVFFWGGG